MNKLVSIFAIFVFLPIVFAQIEYLGIESTIKEDYVESEIVALAPEYLEFRVYGLVLNYSSNIDCRFEGNVFKCYNEAKDPINLRIRFGNIVSKGLNKNIFIQQFELKQSVESVSAIVTLPIGMILSSEESIFPSNYRTLSNGRNIIVYWELRNISNLQPLSFKVEYMPAVIEDNFILKFLKSFYVVIIIALFFVILLIYELIKTKRIVVKKVVKVPIEKVVLEVLDPDEKKIYEILQKEGKIKQNKLVELTGFSKAKVSRVVKKLKDKKLVNLERMGKTNLISLKKKT
ncbi:MAG: winged helix-turn-helix transcriptional regulator [Candidatus Aenigmatarchaeota archaeon]